MGIKEKDELMTNQGKRKERCKRAYIRNKVITEKRRRKIKRMCIVEIKYKRMGSSKMNNGIITLEM